MFISNFFFSHIYVLLFFSFYQLRLGEENNMVTECEMRTFEVDGDSFGSLIDIKENHVARAHFRVCLPSFELILFSSTWVFHLQ